MQFLFHLVGTSDDQCVGNFPSYFVDFTNAGYPQTFVSCTIDNFISNNSSEDEPLIPHFLFEERKKICIKLPYCKKNEIASKNFISKLNSFTNFKYIFIILWQTRQIKSLFSRKDKNLHRSHVIYKGECSWGENFVGETMRNFEVRITEHSNIFHTSEPARHLLENPSHSLQWRVLCSARSYFKRKIIEGLIIQQRSPTLNKKVLNCYVVQLFPSGITCV